MAVLIAPSGDYSVVDGLETVTYFRRTGNSQFDQGTQLANALGRGTKRQEFDESGATLLVIGRTWHLWAADFGPDSGAEPKVNDVIQDSTGARWSVTEIDKQTLKTRWRFTTIQERS